MMRWEKCWKRFEKTGDIRDYLNYTACTREQKELGDSKESRMTCSLALYEKEEKETARGKEIR